MSIGSCLRLFVSSGRFLQPKRICRTWLEARKHVHFILMCRHLTTKYFCLKRSGEKGNLVCSKRRLQTNQPTNKLRQVKEPHCFFFSKKKKNLRFKLVKSPWQFSKNKVVQRPTVTCAGILRTWLFLSCFLTRCQRTVRRSFVGTRIARTICIIKTALLAHVLLPPKPNRSHSWRVQRICSRRHSQPKLTCVPHRSGVLAAYVGAHFCFRRPSLIVAARDDSPGTQWYTGRLCCYPGSINAEESEGGVRRDRTLTGCGREAREASLLCDASVATHFRVTCPFPASAEGPLRKAHNYTRP